MRSIHMFLALPLLSTGCAELRAEYLPATHEPLTVHDQTVLRTGTQQVATGHDEVRDADGNVIATNTHYENQQISWTERDWYPQQGGSRVDDESFFRIVDDKEAAHKYEDYHEHGKTKNTVGWVMLGIGAGLFGGGLGAYEAGKPVVNTDGTVSGGGGLYTAGYVGMTAGLISAGIGTYLILSGKREAATTDARIIDDPDRFKREARQYNADNFGVHAEAAPAPAAEAAAAAYVPPTDTDAKILAKPPVKKRRAKK